MIVEITYTLHAINKIGHEFMIGKELKSPKLILSALNKTAYPPNYKEFKKIYFMKHTKTVVSEEIEYNF
jgi:hypothetical protein